MGDLADDFRKIHKPQGWECHDCDGSGIEVYKDDNYESGKGLRDCPTCGGDGIEPGHPLKDVDDDDDED